MATRCNVGAPALGPLSGTELVAIIKDGHSIFVPLSCIGDFTEEDAPGSFVFRANMPGTSADYAIPPGDKGVIIRAVGITVTLPAYVPAILGLEYVVPNHSGGDATIVTADTATFIQDPMTGAPLSSIVIQAGQSLTFQIETDTYNYFIL